MSNASFNNHCRYLALAALPALAACNGIQPAPNSMPLAANESAIHAVQRPEDRTSLLKLLARQRVIGSAVDPKTGDVNPYGLTISSVTDGPIHAGDLLVCNFNAKSNVQGTGTSIVALRPLEGAKAVHVASDAALKGCDALAIGTDGVVWAAAMVANDNPLIAARGARVGNFKGVPFSQPWGEAFARPKGGKAAYYVTNAGDGSIVRIDLASFHSTVIATGFPVNHGKPGTALAPSGLAYDATIDTLYFADGQNNTIVALRDVTAIGRRGVRASGDGMTFSGPSAASARLVKAGAPLNGPISTALLPNGNLIVGNTLDPAGKNLLVELTPSESVLAVRNVDKGAAGALFGIVATGTGDGDTKVYFNDDNANDVRVLER